MFAGKNIFDVWKKTGKGMKIFLIVLVLAVFSTFFFLLYHDLDASVTEEMKTETCQIAVEHLMNREEIQQKYGSDTIPKLFAIEKHIDTLGITDRIRYRFKFSNYSSDQYMVELRYEFGEWIVYQVVCMSR